MAESNILTPQQVNMANDAEPHEILLAIHKRVVDTEKLMMQYRVHAQNLETTIAMLQERIEKIEIRFKEDEEMWEAVHKK